MCGLGCHRPQCPVNRMKGFIVIRVLSSSFMYAAGWDDVAIEWMDTCCLKRFLDVAYLSLRSLLRSGKDGRNPPSGWPLTS